MNAFSKKTLTALVAVVLLLLVTTGSTLAYIFTKTEPVENTFVPAQVSCAVVENGTLYTANSLTVSSKSNVTIQNTSTVPAYIRAAIIVTWKNEAGNVYALKPVIDVDYRLSVNTTDWSGSGEFYYYYYYDVAANGSTTNLINSASQLSDSIVGSDGTMYSLSIEILAEAIQARGMGATSAQDAWAKAKN